MSVDKIFKSKFGLNRPSKVVTSTKNPVSEIVTRTRKEQPRSRLSEKEILKKELEDIAMRTAALRILDIEEQNLKKQKEVEEQNLKKQKEIVELQNNLISPFTKNRQVDMKPSIDYAIEELLPKARIPEVIEYPEPFEQEPALNRELAEFKKKINNHLHQVGFASSGGGGIGSIADADDLGDLDDGEFLQYRSSDEKFIGASSAAGITSLAISKLDIDGGTDIGAAIVDADLLIIDDGAGGTNRKTTASRIKTYVADITLTTVAQTNITSLGTLTALQIDNININGNAITSTAGTDLTITPLSGQQIVLDGTIIIDAGAVTGATSITSDAFVGDVTGNADTATALASSRNIAGQAFDGTGNITIASTDLSDTSAIALLTSSQTMTNKTLTQPKVNTHLDMLARAELRFQDASGGQYFALEAPATISSSVTFTLPDADGSDGHFLKTDGSGALSFAAASVSSLAADNITVGDAAINLTTSSGNITVDAAANNTDIIFKGTDASSDITMLTLDGSEAGAATFNDKIVIKSSHLNQGITQDSTNLFIILDGTNAASANTGDNIIMDRSAADTDVGDDILHEDFAYMHTGMQREVLEIRDSGGGLLKSMSGFAAGAV